MKEFKEEKIGFLSDGTLVVFEDEGDYQENVLEGDIEGLSRLLECPRYLFEKLQRLERKIKSMECFMERENVLYDYEMEQNFQKKDNSGGDKDE